MFAVPYQSRLIYSNRTVKYSNKQLNTLLKQSTDMLCPTNLSSLAMPLDLIDYLLVAYADLLYRILQVAFIAVLNNIFWTDSVVINKTNYV